MINWNIVTLPKSLEGSGLVQITTYESCVHYEVWLVLDGG